MRSPRFGVSLRWLRYSQFGQFCDGDGDGDGDDHDDGHNDEHQSATLLACLATSPAQWVPLWRSTLSLIMCWQGPHRGSSSTASSSSASTMDNDDYHYCLWCVVKPTGRDYNFQNQGSPSLSPSLITFIILVVIGLAGYKLKKPIIQIIAPRGLHWIRLHASSSWESSTMI